MTIATNMAGRGTDIQLGSNLEMRLEQAAEKSRLLMLCVITLPAKLPLKQVALDAEGLYVIGTEQHESRRIDNQLRGRTGRQGDPGGSKFFIA